MRSKNRKEEKTKIKGGQLSFLFRLPQKMSGSRKIRSERGGVSGGQENESHYA